MMQNSNRQSRIVPSPGVEKLLRSEFHVSRETIAALQIYTDLLVQWQVKTNLVSNSTIKGLWQRHMCDSLQFGQILPSKKKWLDLGTGAGFPGLVLAIVHRNDQDFDVQLVESNSKKCAFLRKVIRETGAAASVTTKRIESVTKLYSDRQVVTARALAPLDKLLGYANAWLEKGAIGLFSKGRDYLVELENCRGVWEFDLILHKSRIEENSVLLEIQNSKRLNS